MFVSKPFTSLCRAEVELEEVWLTEAGLSSLVMSSSSPETGPPPADAVLSTLTRHQAATVRKRLDNYNETLKKRNRQPIRDVREIFTEVGHKHDILSNETSCTTKFCLFQSQVDSAETCSPSRPNHAESSPNRYHTKTKTIRRNANRGIS